MKHSRLMKLAAIAVGALATVPALAIVNLTDGGSSVQIDEVTNANGLFIKDWTLNTGGDQLFENTWWFRTATGPAVRVNSLPIISQQTIGTNTLVITYGNASAQFDIRVSLLGAGNSADLSEQVRVRNISGQSLNMVLYRFSEFDLAGTFPGDTVTRVNSSQFVQTEGPWTVSSNGTGVPMFTEFGVFPAVRNNISAGLNLNTAAGNGIGASLGPADVGFGMQWMEQLGVGGQMLVSTDTILSVVPEPTTMVGLGLGLAALAARRRRK